jgi:transposase
MGDFFDFEREQMASTCLAGGSMMKTATLLGVSRARVPKIMSAYTNHGKTTSAKRSIGRSSTLTERYRRRNTLRSIVSKKNTHNYCSTDDSRN